MARVQVAKGYPAGPTPPVIDAVFSNPCTVGNTITVFVRSDGSFPLVDVTDSFGTTYTPRASSTTGSTLVYVYDGVVSVGGFYTVRATFDPKNPIGWIYAVESDGLAATPLDSGATGARQTSAATDLQTDAFSTAQAQEYVLVAASQDQSATYTAGTDFTLVDGSITVDGSTPAGGVEEYFTSSLLSSYVAHMTSSVSRPYTIVWIAYKLASAAPPLMSQVLC